MPRSRLGGGQGQLPHAPLQTQASGSGPPPPPTNGAKIMAGRSASKVPVPAEQFDLTIDDHMGDAGNDASKVLAEHQQRVLEKK